MQALVFLVLGTVAAGCAGSECRISKKCRASEEPAMFTPPSMVLQVGEQVTFTIDPVPDHLGAEILICNECTCSGAMPLFSATQDVSYVDRTDCDHLGRKCHGPSPDWAQFVKPNGSPQEFTVMNTVHHFDIDHHGHRHGVNPPPRAAYLRVRPANGRNKELALKVQFGQPETIRDYFPALLHEVQQLLESNATQERLQALPEAGLRLASNEDERRAARWMALAVATMPDPCQLTVQSSLGISLILYLTGVRDQAHITRSLQEEKMTTELQNEGTKASKELSVKMNATQSLLQNKLLPQIENLAKTLKDEVDDVEKKKTTAEEDIENKNKEIATLNKKLADTKIAGIFGKVLNILSTVVGMLPIPGASAISTGISIGSTIVGEVTSGIAESVESQIDAAKEALKKSKRTKEVMQRLEGLLDSCGNMVKSLVKARDSNLGLRGWLASPEMIEFKAKLLKLAPDDIEVTMSGVQLMEILRDVGTSLVDAMDKIEFFYNQKMIVDLTTPRTHTADPPMLATDIASLRARVGQHMVQANYLATIRSMQLYALPYCKMLEVSDTEQCMEHGSLNDLVSCSTAIYTSLLAKVMRDQGGIAGNSHVSGSFYVDEDWDRSFATWSQAEHSKLITDVLSGMEVVLKPSAFDSMEDAFVVKFKVIELQFWHPDPAVRMALAAELEDFEVSLTHMGSSHFRCGSGKVLALDHQLVNIWYTFKKNDNGEPADKSIQYEELKHGDMVISPYATWTVQLRPYALRNGLADFAKLQRFASEVSMSLSGKGSFVDADVSCSGCAFDYTVTPPQQHDKQIGSRKRRSYYPNGAVAA